MSEQGSAKSPPLERALGVVGAILLAGLLAFLAYQAAALPDTGPELTASVSTLEHTGNQLVAHVRVENHGGETAEGVRVAGFLRLDGSIVGRANTTVSYVPAGSTRHAALVFMHDPREADVIVAATGYELP